ncbi:MAG: 1-deoxy-D-xylulose-5-phosphate synthase [Anaerohalosphaeraceae bacterium]
MAKLLDTIHGPQDIKSLSAEQLNQLADEIRELITLSVSRTGGHLASNLGVVELTIALHYAFDFAKDRLLWDVGHQCYAHKILTGRKDKFDQLRQEAGLSGFPSPGESPYDVFSVGHAGTSISTALGMALGAQYKNSDEKIVALVGDASIVNGLSFEALNNIGLAKRQMLVVLNDNSMAIDVTQGAVAKFLAGIRLSHTYEDIRKTTSRILEHLPVFGRTMEGALENFKKTLRMAISPSRLFESLNIPYFGPVDGHDIRSLIDLFTAIKELDRPVILHVYTKKGKGFTPADTNPRKYHSTGPFELNGEAGVSATSGKRSFTEAFGDALASLGSRDDKVIAITAAMPDGTGLNKFRKSFPSRYIDVGIAESIAVDIAAGLAKQGFKPFVCIYSTFLQRSIDQIFQEASLQNLPVVFCIDRAGVVGSDGPTHHGMLDIGFMRMLPNMEVLCPADEQDLKEAMEYAAGASHPIAIRYPKEDIDEGGLDAGLAAPYQSGKCVFVRRGENAKIAIVTVGPILAEALKAAEVLKEQGIATDVVNARFAKPVDAAIIELFAQDKTVIIAEDHSLSCGFGSATLEEAVRTAAASDDAVMQKAIGRTVLLAGPDGFIPAAARHRQLAWMGLTSERIVDTVKQLVAGESVVPSQQS